MRPRWDGLRRLVHLATRRGAERDVEAEIAFHLDSRTRDLVARGIAPDEARRIAEHEFGDLGASRHELADATRQRYARRGRRESWESLRHDVAFSVRSIRRTPGPALAIIALLALGVGANAATFAVADELFLRPPAGVAEPGTLRRLYLRTTQEIGGVLTVRPRIQFAAYTGIAAGIAGRADAVAYTAPESASVRVGPARRMWQVAYATSNYFPVLGVRMALGRPFSDDENRMEAGVPVAVISHDVWMREFDGDPGVLGKQLEVALARYTIIGVATSGFHGIDLSRTDLWLPIATAPGPTIDGSPWYRYWHSGSTVRVVARLRDGVAPTSIAAAATGAFRRADRQLTRGTPDTSAVVLDGPLLESMGPSVSEPVERAITTRLLGVTTVVLLIACANVANLLLLSGLRRRREIAIRLSLGISRRRLVRQLLIEGGLLAVVAIIAALFVAGAGASLLRSMILPSVHWSTSPLTWRVVATAVVAGMTIALASAVGPAWRAGKTDLATALKAGARNGAGHSPFRAGLVVVQAALSVLLLAGGGLFLLSLHTVHGIDVGYELDRIAYGTVRFRDLEHRYIDFSDGRSAELTAGLASVAERLRRDPRIEAAALASSAPMAGYSMISLYREDGTRVPELDGRDPALIAAEPSYFKSTGLRLVRGRFFTNDDQSSEARVIVVNETAARTYWPGRESIGQCLRVVGRTQPCYTVIGIVRDMRRKDIVETPNVGAFVPIARTGFFSKPSYLIVRSLEGSAEYAVTALHRELSQEFPSAEPPYVTSGNRAREPELRPWRVGATLFSIFGVLALVVASIGAYSVLAYTVGQRLHEMGVRMALGARNAQIVRLVFLQGLRPLAVGIVCGLGLTMVLGRFVASMLYGTTPTNPFVLTSVACALLVAGSAGCAIPARRAIRVNPATSLRAE